MVRDLTNGKPLKLILAFCIPLLCGNLFQQFYNIVDSIVVGQYVGKDALAAVGSTGSINFLILGFVLGICSGFCIPVAQYFGAGDYENMRKCVVQSLYLLLAITLILTVAMHFLTRPLLELIQTPENIIDDAYTYISIIFHGIVVIMLYNILACILRALGDSKTPLYFLIVASVVNVVLDLVFVLVFKLGVSGVAYATVVAQAVSGVLCYIYIRKKFPILKMHKEDFALDIGIIKRCLYMGLPMAFQFSLTAVGGIVLQSAVNTLGSDTIAAITSANKVQTIVTQPMETIGITIATYCGQNLGAKKYQRILDGVRTSLVMSVIYCVAACLAMVFFGKTISLLFIKPEETAILADISKYLVINGIFYPLLGILFILRNALQGMGYGLPAMIAGIFELVARAMVGFCFVSVFAYNAVCFASPIAWLFALFLLVPVYLWVRHRIKAYIK